MARKESSVEEKSTGQAVEPVRVFSQRRGDIILSDGTSLKFGECLKVSPETAEWLSKSFGALVKVIE